MGEREQLRAWAESYKGTWFKQAAQIVKVLDEDDRALADLRRQNAQLRRELDKMKELAELTL